jgi:tRNA nucleotidyltransferase/poly(A) polymerase
MTSIDPQRAREFAVDIVRRLRDAGYQALWAGGCVRDQLLDLPPKDYDVATDARPEQIRAVFGHRRTLAIGQAFGVITVLGPRRAGQVEVATFRRDAQYSDGRHPDGVTFSDAREDAQRRDFTINGLFYDPLTDHVIDYVGGREDLLRGLVRAIGDPEARLSEDKLRMMRAVRMAARFDFVLDDATLAVIQRRAVEIVVVSSERITAELRLMLTHANRARAAELLQTARLLPIVLPPAARTPEAPGDAAAWQTTLEILRRLPNEYFPAAMATLLRTSTAEAAGRIPVLQQVAQCLALTNDEQRAIRFLLVHESTVVTARELAWPRVQRVLIADLAGRLIEYCRAVAEATGSGLEHVMYCADKLRLPAEELNPPPLLTGDDLKNLGIRPGPIYATILEALRDAQLEERIVSKPEAVQLAKALAASELA